METDHYPAADHHAAKKIACMDPPCLLTRDPAGPGGAFSDGMRYGVSVGES